MINASRTAIETAIDEWIHNEKYRAILKRRLLDAVPFEPLAEEFDMSVRQVKKIVGDYQDKVLLHLK